MVYTKRNPLRVAGSAALSAVLAVGIMMPVAMPTEAYADPTSAEKQAEAQSVLASLNAMQAELDQASNNYYTALDEQAQAQQKMDEAQQRIDEANEQIAGLQERLGDRAKPPTAPTPLRRTCSWSTGWKAPAFPLARCTTRPPGWIPCWAGSSRCCP